MVRTHGWVAPEARGRAPHKGLRALRSAGDPFAGLRPEVLLEHLPPVYDQGRVGCCTAEALAGAIETLLPRAGYAPERPDRVALYWRERERLGETDADAGAILADGVDLLSVLGWEPEPVDPSTMWDSSWLARPAELPADAPRLINAEALDFDAATIATELDAGSVVVVGLSVTLDWDTLTGDTLPPPSGASIGGHAVALVGYSLARRCWRVRNSWGASWGDAGYAWLPFSWTELPYCGEVHALRAVRRAA